MSEHYIEIVTWNKKMMEMYGDKLTGTQKAIGHRSNGLHTSINFVRRGVYFSCTMADGVGGCRFKNIQRTHPYRQSVVRIYVTSEQEARLWAKACDMADVSANWDVRYESDFGSCFYGPNHIKYDKWYATFGFISKWKIWGEHKDMMICNEACANVMLEVWPDLLDIKKELKSFDGHTCHTTKKQDPAALTPDQFHYQAEYYFKNNQSNLIDLSNPTQEDINRMIEYVNKD